MAILHHTELKKGQNRGRTTQQRFRRQIHFVTKESGEKITPISKTRERARLARSISSGTQPGWILRRREFYVNSTLM